MKKTAAILLKIFLGFIVLLLILVLTVPFLFKDRIKDKVVEIINESVEARVEFADYKLGFFRNFPNLTFSLDHLSVTGLGQFENDTLAGCQSLNLVFNLSSLFKKTGYEIKSVLIDKADINTIVNDDGNANWDIMTETSGSDPEEESTSGMKILLKKVELRNSSISYVDHESNITTSFDMVNGSMTGDLTMSETNLEIKLIAGEVTYLMDEFTYLNKATADSKISLRANLDSMKFYLKDNYLLLNELMLNFEGMVAMPGDDIETDLSFRTEQASFKSLLSLIPAVYVNDFKDLRADGEFSLSGTAAGIYSDADSTMPDITLDLSVKNGLISYPSLPEQIKNIRLESNIFLDGKDMDKSTVDINGFHMELAGNPFDLSFSLRTPMSDPDFKGSMDGMINLAALSNALPMDSISLSGLISMSVNMAGQMSVLEREEYQKFKASGNLKANDVIISMSGYPEIKINEAGFEFSPEYAALVKGDLNIGGSSDFILSGRLENYIPYLFKDEVITGNLSLRSKLIDLSDIMSEMAADTTITDTSSLSIIRVPGNINFDFNALIDQFTYNNINVSNVKGHIIVSDGIVSLKETGMDLLGGKVIMNAEYDTRDTLKPLMKADLGITDMGIKDAFNTFNSIQILAPTAKGINGRVGVRLNYSSILGNDFMPLIPTINGGGKLQSDEVTLVESAVYNNMKEVLKLGNNYSNTFKDINISFKVNNGRIYVSPFNTRVGNIRMNISGDQGIDQTINYVVRTEIPRSDLGNSVNSLIDGLSVQAAAFGFTFKPSELIRVNVRVTGTFLRPIVTPFFGDAPADSTKSIKETARETVIEAVEGKVVQAKEKVRSEAEIQADKVVQEAEEQAQRLKEEAAKAAGKIRMEAETQAQMIIKEAESKGALARLAAQKAADSVRKEAGKRADQVVAEADEKGLKLIEGAKIKREELLDKI